MPCYGCFLLVASIHTSYIRYWCKLIPDATNHLMQRQLYAITWYHTRGASGQGQARTLYAALLFCICKHNAWVWTATRGGGAHPAPHAGGRGCVQASGVTWRGVASQPPTRVPWTLDRITGHDHTCKKPPGSPHSRTQYGIMGREVRSNGTSSAIAP